MAKGMGQGLPILVAGGGIGGLAAATRSRARAFRRVLEQAPEFREIGAGIQLGPNIFQALDRMGSRTRCSPTPMCRQRMEMRCALSGDRDHPHAAPTRASSSGSRSLMR